MKTTRRDMLPAPESLLHLPAGVAHMLSCDCNGADTRMLISITNVQRIAMALHGIDEASPDAATVQNRFRYLARNGFPRKTAAKRGQRVSVSIEDALKLSLAFEFFSLGTSTSLVFEAITQEWTEIRYSLILAWIRTPFSSITAAAASPGPLLQLRRDFANNADAGVGALTLEDAMSWNDRDEVSRIATATLTSIHLGVFMAKFTMAVEKTISDVREALRAELELLGADSVDMSGKLMSPDMVISETA